MKRLKRERIGIFMIKTSILVWVIDVLTKLFSTAIGMVICGDTYMCEVDGVVGDCSCGFNTDLHLTFILMSILLLGIVLVISAKKHLSSL